MENATDALIIAGSVLLLIIALTVSISSFSNFRMQFDEIVSQDDALELTKDTNGEYLNYLKSNDEDVRTVGIETVISSIRRIRKENYVIYICLTKSSMPNVSDEIKVTTKKNQLYYIDKKNKIKNLTTSGQEVIKLTMVGIGNQHVENDDEIAEIYKTLKNSQFKEYIGIYQNKTDKGVSEANKTTYRIITFVEENT